MSELFQYVVVLEWPVRIEFAAVAIGLGLVVGLTYALLAAGLILVYRSSRVLNLAHGEIGAFGAAAMAVLVNDYGLPYWFAALIGVALAALVGGIVELTIIRRLFRAPRLMLLVATLGLAQLFLLFTFLLNDSIDTQNRLLGFPLPFEGSLTLGRLVLRAGELSTLVVVPLVTIGMAAFFRYSAFGVAVRASAENADSARLVGIPTRRVSTFVWMLAAALAAVTALLLSPGKGLTVTESLGPDLLMRALAAAVLAKMTSLPRAVVAGLAIGVIEQVGLWNVQVGRTEVVLFIVVLVAMLLQARQGTRTEEASSWTFGQLVRPVPRAIAGLRAVRVVNWATAVALVAVAACLPLVLSNSQTFLLTTVVAFAIAALSVTVLTGFGGQISLGQIGLFGIGAATSYQLTYQLRVPFWTALLLVGLVGAAISMVIGVPALRTRGLFPAITTLGFALVANKWLLLESWTAGPGVIATRPFVGPLDFIGQKAYYELALGALCLAALLTRNVLRSGVGRNLLAVRDNEAHAAAFTVPLIRTKLYAFALAGFLAAFGGAVYGHGVERFSATNFPLKDSLRLVSMTVIGGLGSIPGTVLGAFFVVGVDRLIRVDYLRLMTTSVGLLLLLLYLPGGFGQIIYGLRDRVHAKVAARWGTAPAPEHHGGDDAEHPSLPAVDPPPGPPLGEVAAARELVDAAP